MTKTVRLLTLFLVGLTLFPPLARATQDSQVHPDVLFEQGSAAFRAGNYEQGLALFREARAQGLNNVSLLYNIGVCAYKLGDYAQARQAFWEVSREPDMASLAYYNLGLIGLRENDRDAARKWFAKTIETTADAKLKNMAEVALEDLATRSKLSWFGFAYLGGGYDDNVKIVTDTATQTSSGVGDSFSELLTMARGPLLSPDSHLNLQLSGYSRNYVTENGYDYSSLSLKLFHRANVQSWHSETGADYSYSFLGSAEYARIPSGFIELRKDFSTGMFFRTRDTFSYLEMLDMDYDSFTGTRNRLQLEAGRKWGRALAAVEYLLELNERDDPDESPTRNALKLKFNAKPGQHTMLYAAGSYQRSRYEINGAADRHEDLATASLRLTYNVSRDWLVGAEYNYEDNQCDDATYEYARNMAILSMTRNF